MFKVFDLMFTPILCYAVGISGYAYSEQTETVHANFCFV